MKPNQCAKQPSLTLSYSPPKPIVSLLNGGKYNKLNKLKSKTIVIIDSHFWMSKITSVTHVQIEYATHIICATNMVTNLLRPVHVINKDSFQRDICLSAAKDNTNSTHNGNVM